jgi:hypothetical protein
MGDGNSDTAHSGGLKKTLASMLKSPAIERRKKVLVSTFDQADGDDSSIYSDRKETPLTDEEKVKKLVDKRNASSPTGDFVLGVYKPAACANGMDGIYVARAALGK